MLQRFGAWFKALSTIGKVGVVSASVIGLGVVGSAASPNPTPTVNLQSSPVNQTDSESPQPKATSQTVTTTEPVPFETTEVNDASLAKGTTQTKTEGVNGVRTHTFQVNYEDGKEVSRVEISNEITTQPVTKVVVVGTYVAPQQSCPNGTYVNSAGNTVCSPYASPTAPAGATAECRDGTYSFSQSRSGTCSHHGGVASWL